VTLIVDSPDVMDSPAVLFVLPNGDVSLRLPGGDGNLMHSQDDDLIQKSGWFSELNQFEVQATEGGVHLKDPKTERILAWTEDAGLVLLLPIEEASSNPPASLWKLDPRDSPGVESLDLPLLSLSEVSLRVSRFDIESVPYLFVLSPLLSAGECDAMLDEASAGVCNLTDTTREGIFERCLPYLPKIASRCPKCLDVKLNFSSRATEYSFDSASQRTEGEAFGSLSLALLLDEGIQLSFLTSEEVNGAVKWRQVTLRCPKGSMFCWFQGRQISPVYKFEGGGETHGVYATGTVLYNAA